MTDISQDAISVRNALIAKGIETPMIDLNQCKEVRRLGIAKHMHEVMKLIGLDLRDDSLEETPNRLAKMFIDEIFSGMDYANFPKMTKIKNQMKVSEMVQVCVAYYPKDWVIGLSKINRIVSFFAQRPQVQERLTEQLLTAFQTILETEDVAVYIKATHFCVKARGIKDTNSYTITSAYGGVFLKDRDTRKEFLATIQK